MSVRLLLVGGPGGAGSSTWAARMADWWAKSGASVAVLSLDEQFGAQSLTTHPGCRPVGGGMTVSSTLSCAMAAWGVDPFAVDLLRSGIGSSGLPALWRLPEALETHDRVVVDLGAAFGRTIVGVHQLPWLISAAGPLHSGWLRAARPVTALAMGASAIGKAGTTQLAELSERSTRLSDLVMSTDTAGVIVTAAQPHKVRRAAALATLAQLRVGAFVGPHYADGLGTPTWAELTDDWEARLADRPRSVDVRGSARGGDVIWRISLPYNDFDEIDLQQSGARLALGMHGQWRTFALPSLLARHAARAASLRQGILEVTFSPETTDRTRGERTL